jgi:hypothetical protein
MLNVQTLGILLRALRDGNARPDALRAPGAVAGVARVTPVEADANESVRGDAAVRTLPALRQSLPEVRADEHESQSPPGSRGAEASPQSPRGIVAQPPHHGQAAASALLQDAHASKSSGAHASQSTLDPRVAPRAANAPAHGTTSAPAAAAYTAQAGSTTPQSTALALSPTGRWLTEVQNRPPQALASAPRTMAPPLVSDPSAPAPAVASSLERAVTSSGLFYESHLARWIRDDVPFASLAREPQASWPASAHADATPAAAPSLPQDPEKLALVARQLETLETKMIVWTGSVWPNQSASIEIREDERGATRDAPSDKPARASWRTRITMTLPSLGTVEATLSLRGETVELSLVAREAAQARLEAARGELSAALAARSLELAAFSIGDGDGR